MPDDKRIISTQILEDTADAIREKLGTQAGITPAEFANNISQIGTLNLQDKTITPTTSQQVIEADQGYQGLDTVTVEAVTSSIDANIQAENIKKDVSILGVTGTLESGINIENNINKETYYSRTSTTNTDSVRLMTIENPRRIKVKRIIGFWNSTNSLIDISDGSYTLYTTYVNNTVASNGVGNIIVETINNEKYVTITKHIFGSDIDANPLIIINNLVYVLYIDFDNSEIEYYKEQGILYIKLGDSAVITNVTLYKKTIHTTQISSTMKGNFCDFSIAQSYPFFPNFRYKNNYGYGEY